MGLRTYILALLLIPSSILAKDLGTWGNTYPVDELDMIVTLQNNAKKVDWKEVFSAKKMQKRVDLYRPADLSKPLPIATKARVFYPDMSAVVQQDIKGPNGDILYPKGYRYNPTDVITLTNIYIVLNAKDPKQIAWFKSSRYFTELRVRILAIDAESFTKLSTVLKRPAYYLNQQITERFKLKAVPSIISQDRKSRKIRVEEVLIPDEPKEDL